MNYTSLHYAAIKNYKEIGEILILKGANINATSHFYQNLIIIFLVNIIEKR